eukprot:1137243-Pelagomonas_calceolata.AAC.4
MSRCPIFPGKCAKAAPCPVYLSAHAISCQPPQSPASPSCNQQALSWWGYLKANVKLSHALFSAECCRIPAGGAISAKHPAVPPRPGLQEPLQGSRVPLRSIRRRLQDRHLQPWHALMAKELYQGCRLGAVTGLLFMSAGNAEVDDSPISPDVLFPGYLSQI